MRKTFRDYEHALQKMGRNLEKLQKGLDKALSRCRCDDLQLATEEMNEAIADMK